MKIMAVLATKRIPLAGFVSSTIVMLLLSWHVSFKVGASDNTYISVEQNVLPVLDISIDEHDFDWVVNVDASLKIDCCIASANFITLPSQYLRRTAIPFSRAPPNTL
jgi:hypothetical protein